MSSQSSAYIVHANPICFRLLMLAVFLAAILAWANTGNRIAARIAMIAITTSSSMRVNARAERYWGVRVLGYWIPRSFPDRRPPRCTVSRANTLAPEYLNTCMSNLRLASVSLPVEALEKRGLANPDPEPTHHLCS